MAEFVFLVVVVVVVVVIHASLSLSLTQSSFVFGNKSESVGKGMLSIAKNPVTAPINKMNPTIVAVALFG